VNPASSGQVAKISLTVAWTVFIGFTCSADASGTRLQALRVGPISFRGAIV
jgi:hypothetical protein